MDPVNVIVSALIVGAAETSKELVKDTYAALKSLIGKLLHRKKDAPDPIATAEANPEARDKVTEAVKKAYGSRDKLIDALAKALGKAKDKDYLAKLGGFPLPRLLDLAKSAERRAKKA